MNDIDPKYVPGFDPFKAGSVTAPPKKKMDAVRIAGLAATVFVAAISAIYLRDEYVAHDPHKYENDILAALSKLSPDTIKSGEPIPWYSRAETSGTVEYMKEKSNCKEFWAITSYSILVPGEGTYPLRQTRHDSLVLCPKA